jgi:hypothetical protein
MKFFLAALGIAFSLLIVWAASLQPLGESITYIVANPWGVVTLADLYLGFVLFVLFVFKTSTNHVKAIAWSIALLVLGNVIAVIYLILYLKHMNQTSESEI